jgi:hypothetical protein
MYANYKGSRTNFGVSRDDDYSTINLGVGYIFDMVK